MKKANVTQLTYTALMTALLCVLAPLSIPVASVPISASTFVISLAAVLLGSKYSMICVCLYLLIGMVGVPVFAGWRSGISVILGPTGGYLIGYLFIALFTGIFMKYGKEKLVMIIIGMVLGTVSCYVIGTAWLAYELSLDLRAALMAGVIPFIPGDIIKIVVCAVISIPIKKQLKRSMELQREN